MTPFDEITLAAQLMPDLPENHSSLSYIFYRLDDGPNAVAEARNRPEHGSPKCGGVPVPRPCTLFQRAIRRGCSCLRRIASARFSYADTYYDLGINHCTLPEINPPPSPPIARPFISTRFLGGAFHLALVFHEQKNLEDAIADIAKPSGLRRKKLPSAITWEILYCDRGDFDAAILELGELYRQHPSGNGPRMPGARLHVKEKLWQRHPRMEVGRLPRIPRVPLNTACSGKPLYWMINWKKVSASCAWQSR